MDAIAENRVLSRWAQLLPRPPGQIGAVHEADAELLPLGDGDLLALTIDTVAEEIRVGLYREPETAGRVAACAALSDLAAVGAEPLGLLLSVGLPSVDAHVIQQEIAAGVGAVCRAAGTHVVGGDTSDAESLMITCAGIGRVPQTDAIRRVGIQPGDRLLASGPLGDGNALAAVRWLGGPEALFPERAYQPSVRIRHGRALRGIASACMDTSDGLITTLDQLARLNQVAIRIEPPLRRMLSPRADAMGKALAIPAFAFLAGLHGEFELVFAVPPARSDALDRAAAAFGWRPIEIGRAEVGAGVVVGKVALDGARIRNLLASWHGDIAAYAAALVDEDPEK